MSNLKFFRKLELITQINNFNNIKVACNEESDSQHDNDSDYSFKHEYYDISDKFLQIISLKKAILVKILDTMVLGFLINKYPTLDDFQTIHSKNHSRAVINNAFRISQNFQVDAYNQNMAIESLNSWWVWHYELLKLLYSNKHPAMLERIEYIFGGATINKNNPNISLFGNSPNLDELENIFLFSTKCYASMTLKVN